MDIELVPHPERTGAYQTKEGDYLLEPQSIGTGEDKETYYVVTCTTRDDLGTLQADDVDFGVHAVRMMRARGVSLDRQKRRLAERKQIEKEQMSHQSRRKARLKRKAAREAAEAEE